MSYVSGTSIHKHSEELGLLKDELAASGVV